MLDSMRFRTRNAISAQKTKPKRAIAIMIKPVLIRILLEWEIYQISYLLFNSKFVAQGITVLAVKG
jgi:hypothetical protein